MDDVANDPDFGPQKLLLFGGRGEEILLLFLEVG